MCIRMCILLSMSQGKSETTTAKKKAINMRFSAADFSCLDEMRDERGEDRTSFIKRLIYQEYDRRVDARAVANEIRLLELRVANRETETARRNERIQFVDSLIVAKK